MKVSEEIQINNSEAVRFSKCGNYLAFGSRKRLTVINVESSETISTLFCTNDIKTLHWHHDSDLILCLLDGNKIEVYSLSSSGWVFKCEEEEPGLKDAVWSPNNYYILILAKFNVRISVWSLTGNVIAHIDNPILKTDNFPFSPDGNYFAVIIGTIHNYKILIYSTSTWILYQTIPCTNEIHSPSSPLWSPTNLHIAIWDTLDIKTVFLEVYSVNKGEIDGFFKKTEPYKLCGICDVVWVPSGQFLLVGCYDECIYVLNYITWGVVTILNHLQVIKGDDCAIYEENQNEKNFNIIKQRPVTLTKLKPLISLTPKISCIACDYGGNYVATKCASMPAVLWIWEVGMFSLKTVVILRNNVAKISWNFNNMYLLICSKRSNAILWTPPNIMHIELSNIFGRCLNNSFWCPNKNGTLSIISGSYMVIVRDLNK